MLYNPPGMVNAMNLITKETVQSALKRGSRRICFYVYPDQSPKITTEGNFYGTINLPFGDGLIKKIFPYKLYQNKSKKGHVWRGFKSENEFKQCSQWCEERKNYVYIRDCLSGLVALDFNKPDSKTPTYTEIGRLVDQVKTAKNEKTIDKLVKLSLTLISKTPPYQSCDSIVAVPAQDKTYDLPTTLASILSSKLSITNLTEKFIYQGIKQSIKEVSDNDYFDKKWQIWEKAQVSYKGQCLQKNLFYLLMIIISQAFLCNTSV
ncbi:MAG: hypothetical protein IPK86_00425 [Neisseriales bacterium]|nr:MAG: hypothetical protein IPK86_00425 [Neisseriales bacterium]